MFTRLLTALTVVAAVSAPGYDARAASVTAAYAAGYEDVLINGFGTEGLGTFRLDDAGSGRIALCIEADQPHSTRLDAYARVPTTVDAAELDTLIWLIERAPVDDDLAIAAAALAWYYAGASRPGGVPVWSDGTRSFASIGPAAPESWDALAPFGMHHPIGLRAGGVDLDAAERRLAELDRRVRSLAGPWILTADADTGRFRLNGPAGPIAGQMVTITITTPDATVVTLDTVTDQQGRTEAVEPVLHNGATVAAVVTAPGPHEEWDGAGAVQRMITATTIESTASFEMPPSPRHVVALKHSTDATIGVQGAEFAVLDSTGSEIERAISDTTGRALFSPINPIRHRGPYLVTEIAAPAGLLRSAPDVTIDDASPDPDHPTVAEFTDEPITVPVSVRKRLTTPAAGPADRSGFVFRFVRRQDGSATQATSGNGGETATVSLPLGTYDVCEIGMPDWAAGLRDGGCQALEVSPARLSAGAALSIDYVNMVPPPQVDTMARDALDGDRRIGVDGAIVIDQVTLTELTPGTTYTVAGQLVTVGAGDDDGGASDPIARSSVTFTAASNQALIELHFEVPPTAPATLVVTEQISIGEIVVAVHDDLTDADQTIAAVAPSTTTTTAPPPPTITTTTTTTTTTTPPVHTMPTTTTTTSTTTPLPPVRTTPPAPPPTLPRTGNEAADQLLRLGDIGFVAGVGLIAVTGLLPRRREP